MVVFTAVPVQSVDVLYDSALKTGSLDPSTVQSNFVLNREPTGTVHVPDLIIISVYASPVQSEVGYCRVVMAWHVST